MLTFRRPERADIIKINDRPVCRIGLQTGLCYFLQVLVVTALLGAAPPTLAQAAGAQRAIEKLERCSKQERQQGCVNILKREYRGENRQAIKAQVRGSRIIWYEFNRKTGKVRRTN